MMSGDSGILFGSAQAQMSHSEKINKQICTTWNFGILLDIRGLFRVIGRGQGLGMRSVDSNRGDNGGKRENLQVGVFPEFPRISPVLRQNSYVLWPTITFNAILDDFQGPSC